jgi:hypothetical protein
VDKKGNKRAQGQSKDGAGKKKIDWSRGSSRGRGQGGEVNETRNLCCHAIGEVSMREGRRVKTKRGTRGSGRGALNGDHCY